MKMVAIKNCLCQISRKWSIKHVFTRATNSRWLYAESNDIHLILIQQQQSNGCINEIK